MHFKENSTTATAQRVRARVKDLFMGTRFVDVSCIPCSPISSAINR